MIGVNNWNIQSEFWDSVIEKNEVMYWINDGTCVFCRFDLFRA